ncbi:MAG: hypothetical protein ABDH66_00330, partial [Bacteroidia bacterium]
MNLRALAGLALSWAFAQLSGIVNQYAAVLAPSDPSTLTVDNPAFFSVGDRILVYQAKGATINTTNDNTYGDIIDIGGAGLFEFNKIAGISGNALTLQCPLTRPFNFSNPTTARIQVIKVSYHPGDVTITGTVTAPPWDGQKGGVVVIETEGTLTFAADIDVAGRGFRGGLRSQNNSGSGGCNANTYHGPYDDQGARKGESIAEPLNLNHTSYRGKAANGGGGGNAYDTGGGGGANYGTGGQGGWTTCASGIFACPGNNVANSGFGLGGASLSSYLNATNFRLFMGGGGGGGHQNNNQAGNGGNGGGVVIIRAASINGGGHQIIASGTQGIQNLENGCGQFGVNFAGNDGGGGGGAGGSIALFCNTFIGTLTADAQGANGHNCSSHLCSCRPDHGPGGGGGGGYIGFSTTTTPPNVNLLLSGGQHGIELTPASESVAGCNNSCNVNCPGTACQCSTGLNPTQCLPPGPQRLARGATSGAAGGVLYGISFTPYNACPLSEVSLRRWEVRSLPTGTLQHTWEITSSDSITAFSLRLRNIYSKDDYLYAPPASNQGSYEHALLPGVYEGLLTVRTAAGTTLNLGTKLIRHEIPFVWEANQLHISDSQGGAFYLYDPSGRLILTGQPPQT